jgi:hypothetical protein
MCSSPYAEAESDELHMTVSTWCDVCVKNFFYEKVAFAITTYCFYILDASSAIPITVARLNWKLLEDNCLKVVAHVSRHSSPSV